VHQFLGSCTKPAARDGARIRRCARARLGSQRP
jgi:hypothetical protein